MMWLAAECKWAYVVPYYNSSICDYHFEHQMLMIVYGSESFAFYSIYPDTTTVSPVSDMTSGSTALARSLTLKFEF